MERVLQVVGGMNRAGAETFLMNVYRKLDRTKLQFDFLVYTDEKQDYEDEIVSLGGQIIHMPCHAGFGMIKSISKIKKVIREYGPYVAVHAHTLHNIAFVLLALKGFKNVKCIAHSHCTQNAVRASFIKKLYEKWSLNIIRKNSKYCLACGEEAGLYLFGDKFREQGIVVNNGVDVETYFQSESISETEKELWGIKSDDLIIGNIARFSPVKNHAFMIEFAKYLQKNDISFKMLLIGQGELYQEIAEKIKAERLEERVLLLGLREDIPKLLKTMDVFFMPSLFEGNPVTLVEAQASGIPCVISDTITAKMDIGLDLIYRCSLADNMSAWYEAIQKIKSKKVSKTEVESAFTSKRYDINSVVNLLISIYEKD
jgi:glycosyltransferase EpsF